MIKYVLKSGNRFIGEDSETGYIYETNIDGAKKFDASWKPMDWLDDPVQFEQVPVQSS